MPCCCLPIFLAISLLLTAFWIWMIVEVTTKEPEGEQDKLVWVLVVILGHTVGAAIYYFVRRPERIRKFGR